MSLTYPKNQQHNLFNTPWTAERDAMLKQLWADGYSAALIADKMANGHKLTRCAVIGRAHRLKLPARRDKQPLERKPYRANGKAPKPPRWRPPPPPPPQPSRLRPAASAPTPQTEPAMRRLRLVQLERHHCHWPLRELHEVVWLFCGADTHEGAVYCPHHTWMARPRGKQ